VDGLAGVSVQTWVAWWRGTVGLRRDEHMNAILKAYWNLIFRLTGLDVSFDIRYPRWSYFLIELRARFGGVSSMLRARRLTPKETAPGETRLQIVGCDMQDVHISGPYKELSIQVPVEAVESIPGGKSAHLWLPVTTEAARWPGVDIYGFPKFIAAIDCVHQTNQVAWTLKEHGASILDFGMRDEVGASRQERWQYYGTRKGQTVLIDFDVEGPVLDRSGGAGAYLSLGSHPIASALREVLVSDDILRTVVGHQVSSVLRKPVPVAGRA
jgi:hypothetical protein